MQICRVLISFDCKLSVSRGGNSKHMKCLHHWGFAPVSVVMGLGLVNSDSLLVIKQRNHVLFVRRTLLRANRHELQQRLSGMYVVAALRRRNYGTERRQSREDEQHQPSPFQVMSKYCFIYLYIYLYFFFGAAKTPPQNISVFS